VDRFSLGTTVEAFFSYKEYIGQVQHNNKMQKTQLCTIDSCSRKKEWEN